MSFYNSTYLTNERRNDESYNSRITEDLVALDLKRLKDENIRLQEELAQCQVDKEFVWSLWKKLQITSPDITEAVALVVERERQKTEDKDRKVLDILRIKDDNIIELQKTIDDKDREIGHLSHVKLEAQDDAAKYKLENARVLNDLTELKQHMHNEKLQTESKISQLIATIEDLNKTCEGLQQELKKSTDELKISADERDNKSKLAESLQERNTTLQRELQELTVKGEKLNELAKKYENQLRKVTQELKHKAKELDAVRRELSDLWAAHNQCLKNAQQREEIIKQLENLQINTEKVLRDYQSNQDRQTDEHQMANQQLLDELTVVKNKVVSQNQQIVELEQALINCRREKGLALEEEPLVQSADLLEEKWKTRMYHMERENEQLREKILDKNRVIDRLSKRTDANYLDNSVSDDNFARKKHLRSKSESGLNGCNGESKRIQVLEARLEESEIKLQLRETHLTALKQAHKRRLLRLKSLLTSYKLIREQLKVAEDELGRPPKKRLKFKRPSDKQLQHEDKEAAWNELRFVKHENKNLQVIKMNLEEQIDDMTVKAAEDASQIHTLKLQLASLEADLRFEKDIRVVPHTPAKQKDGEREKLQNKIESLKQSLGSQQTRMEQLTHDNTVLVEEKITLKHEINCLKKSLYERQSSIAELQAEISSLKRRLRRTQKRTGKTSYTSPLARRYDEVLSESIHGLQAALAVADRSLHEEKEPLNEPRAENEESDWIDEEVDEFPSETLSELGQGLEPEATDSAVSLGEAIVRKAIQLETTASQTSPNLMFNAIKSQRKRTKEPKKDVKTVQDSNTSPAPVRYIVHRRPLVSAYSQVSSLKQRLVSLQMKVSSLTSARDQVKVQLEEVNVTCDQLQKQLSAANLRLQTQRAAMLSHEGEISAAQKTIDELKLLNDQSVPRAQSDQEKKSLESKVKSLIQDCSRKNEELKELKVELENSKETNTELNERITRLERDVAQKRTLLEDLRLKLRLASENAKTELQQLEVKSEEVERTKQILEQNKATMESLKVSVKALTKEKKEYEKKFTESQKQLLQKEKQLSTVQGQVQSLQREMDTLQETARQQLVNLAAQGESAVSVAQSQLLKSHQLIEQFHLLLKSVSDGLVSRQQSYIHEKYRRAHEEKRKNRMKSESKSMTEAKRRAQEILNLTASDIDSFLSSNDESDEEESFSEYWHTEVQKWVKQWQSALSGESFAKKVAGLFINKVDEITNLR